ncbi:hypothetical protein [Actinoplanes sp. NBRC 103695]|uniref:hypothetical protein n=1 Tax=Actinoplanes sp. NBRC 103695 TaxID=3032202 RepID=UPI0024A290A4|nr:hypothetical protein [Actinoplanes sp. NBRC 103695]GLY95286.1 hypothetical protein Acsp02_25410 [Actinoplanes sp. NBRC 103695]
MLLVECPGAHATDGGVLERLSAGTEAALVQWNRITGEWLRDEHPGEAAKRRAHGWAAVHGRLREDPREALRAVLTQARQADPDGWAQSQRDVIAVLSA